MDDLKYILKHFSSAFKLPILLFDSKKHIIKKFQNSLTPVVPMLYLNRINPLGQTNTIYLYVTQEQDSFSVVYLDNPQNNIIVLWSSSHNLNNMKTPTSNFTEVNIELLIEYSTILYFSIYQKRPIINQPISILKHAYLSSNKNNKIVQNEINTDHGNYLKEQSMMNAIKLGNPALFERQLKTFIPSGSPGKMIKGNDLREKKDLLIVSITLFTRAAIQGGMRPEAAYDLSDLCIQKVEALSTIGNHYEIMLDIGKLFIKHIRINQGYPHFKLIYSIQDFVYHHLNSRTNLTDLALQLNYSKNYLCATFKKETGKTIVQYINELRITEAQNQIIFSKKNLSDIANSLGFTSQSYFSKTFKKYTQLSPKQYRSKFQA